MPVFEVHTRARHRRPADADRPASVGRLAGADALSGRFYEIRASSHWRSPGHVKLWVGSNGLSLVITNGFTVITWTDIRCERRMELVSSSRAAG